MFSGEAPLICFLFSIKTQENKKIENFDYIKIFYSYLENMNVTNNIAICFQLYLTLFIIKLFSSCCTVCRLSGECHSLIIKHVQSFENKCSEKDNVLHFQLI